MKRKSNPSDHLLLGLAVITLEVGLTWYYYLKGKLKARRPEDTTSVPVPGTKSSVTDEAFEEELARTSAGNGNGRIVDEPCEECEDDTETASPNLSGEEEESESSVSSLPEDRQPPSPAETETPETDTY